MTTEPTYDQLKAKVAEYKAAIEAVKCFQCGDGLTPLYCLNCARQGLEKENATLKQQLAKAQAACGEIRKMASELLRTELRQRLAGPPPDMTLTEIAEALKGKPL